ncbi:hypothetical protein [Paraglaciecola sp. MB-3u-78]|uniref:sulfotransferase-like domain-containing protein n=1 Tax=Paraglaciecola sp. MB-3u-78 TaxID=2058332 RepID=UPI0021028960|nr:hypothetical protein [Paraglaciecola sp. MB-3u-78]
MTKSVRHSLHFLWCVPRSRSTAFEKMMVNSGQFNVIGEPFIDIYKQGMLSSHDVRITQRNFNQVFDSLSQNSLLQPVFVKDMAYHVTPFISDSQILSAQHTFLIRDPKLSIPSLFKMRENFHENETGFTGQSTLFKRIYTLTGNKPFIVDAEQLIRSPIKTVGRYFDSIKHVMPKDVLDWHPGSRDEWKERESWHIDAINSSGFVDTKRDVKTEPLPSRIAQIIQKNMVPYNYMWEQLSQQKLDVS